MNSKNPAKKSAKKAFGNRVREARENLELTQEQVARKAKITANYYAMIERGEVNPSFEKIKSIAKVLKLKITIS
jgi:transcriptional regulator with XRE-family HTH domain